ncbi:RNA polymerase sigma factor [Ralstonia pickettii]|nr:RNA polymerase sigma factor [Ralstonia pickettii]
MSTINFTEIYSIHYHRLVQIGYSITKDIQLAEDVVQETFIKAIKRIDSIQDKGKLPAWLSVIAKRTAIDMIRSEQKKKGILMEQDTLESLVKEINYNVEEEVEITLLME